MKFLQHTLITFLMVAGLSIAASAQKDQEKPKPKPSPPVVDPIKKPPPDPNKPKKPSMAFVVVLPTGKSDTV